MLLGHAILNLNPTVTAFYLREGVPLRCVPCAGTVRSWSS